MAKAVSNRIVFYFIRVENWHFLKIFLLRMAYPPSPPHPPIQIGFIPEQQDNKVPFDCYSRVSVAPLIVS